MVLYISQQYSFDGGSHSKHQELHVGGDDSSYEMADDMFKIMSSFLFQGNVEKKCFFLPGEGRNGC